MGRVTPSDTLSTSFSNVRAYRKEPGELSLGVTNRPRYRQVGTHAAQDRFEIEYERALSWLAIKTAR
jgi:hypothetical protein